VAPTIYAGEVVEPAIRDFLSRCATPDVCSTVEWLEEHEYQLTESQFQPPGSTWYTLFVFTADAQVGINCERSQWSMDIAPAPGAEWMQYDLLIAASRGRDYADCFPSRGDILTRPLPKQLPEGVSWRSTLPAVLDWISGPGVAQAVAHAQDQRYVMMWPDSPEAKQLLRTWRAGPASEPPT
jgi:hypothetical protein